MSAGRGPSGTLDATMVDVWARLEPHLASVQKPARYIGCELGAEVPSPAPDRVGWLLVYPDTYEIGLPNQGLQILYEILNERADALAERSYAPWTDLEEVMRREDIPLFSVDTHRSADEFDVIAFNLSAELVYTNVLNCLDLAGVPGAVGRPRRRSTRSSAPAATPPTTRSRWPTSSTSSSSATARRSSARSTRSVGGVEGRRSQPTASTSCGRSPASRACTSRPCTRPATSPTAGSRPPCPIDPAAPAVVEKRTIADLADWPYPKQQLVPLTEVVHDRLNVEVFRGCTRGCRFCQAGMITRPVRERPADQVQLDGPAGPPPHRLRRGGPHEPVHGRLLGHRGRRHLRHGRLGRLRQRLGEPAEPPGRRLHGRASPPRSRRPAAPASPSPPRPARGACAR